MYLPSGTRLGPYRIEAPIGAGGMGEVYRATDTRLNRDVAVKILPSRLTAEPAAKQRFEREAHTASALNDPHICTIYDVGEHEGRQFLVMELLEGRTLRQYMDGQGLAVEQVLKLGMQIAAALQTAHGKGIIHRDVKPANIFVTEGGEIKVLDFGLAKLFLPVASKATSTELAETATMSTDAGLLLGTVEYMAPEQIEGEPVDPRTDLYALGLVLYELATGRNPFIGRSPTSTIANILKESAPPIAQQNPVAPPELGRILQKCLRKRMDERYASARDLSADLITLRRSLGPKHGDSAVVAPSPIAPLAMSRTAARALLLLIQIGYLGMYAIALYKFHDVLRVSQELYGTAVLGQTLLLAGVLGVPVRLYQFTAVSLDYSDFGRKFRWLFPVVLLLDEAWTAAPLLFLGQLQGVVLLCTAALAYLPFSQRILVYAAYAHSGGRWSAIEMQRSP